MNINNHFVGDYRDKAYWFHDGVQELLSPEAEQGYAYDINDDNKIVGRARLAPYGMRGMIWIDGVGYFLQDLVVNCEDCSVGRAYAINNLGQIVANGGIRRGETLLLTPIYIEPPQRMKKTMPWLPMFAW